MNTGVTLNVVIRQTKSSMEKIMRLMLGEVIMSDRHMSDGQMDLFLQLFFKTEKFSLN